MAAVGVVARARWREWRPARGCVVAHANGGSRGPRVFKAPRTQPRSSVRWCPHVQLYSMYMYGIPVLISLLILLISVNRNRIGRDGTVGGPYSGLVGGEWME